ncbi:MAG: hypothetical protein AAFZ18_10400 [Myxococcota bacterium]
MDLMPLAAVATWAVLTVIFVRRSGLYRSAPPAVRDALALRLPSFERLRRIETISGREVHFDVVYVGPESYGNSERDAYRSTLTIRGALPTWVSFGLDASQLSLHPSDPANLWGEILFGELPVELPASGLLLGSDGNLVFESTPSPFPPDLSAIVQKLQPFLNAPPNLAETLERYVEGPSPAGAVAFSILWRQSPFEELTSRLARRHRDTHDEALAAVIAAYDGPRGETRLLAMMATSSHAGVRETAMTALLAEGRLEPLLRVDPERVPEGLRLQHVEALLRFRDPASEATAISYLHWEDTRSAALDLIAAVGGRASMGPLVALQAAKVDPDGALGLDVTVELVRGRLTSEGAARGGLALAEPDPEGAMSLSGERTPKERS